MTVCYITLALLIRIFKFSQTLNNQANPSKYFGERHFLITIWITHSNCKIPFSQRKPNYNSTAKHFARKRF